MMSSIKAEDHIALAFKITTQYLNLTLGQSVEDSEEFADALMGLTKAARAFDPNEGNEFSTLAYHCINNEIRNGLKRRRRQFIPNTSIVGGISKNDEANNGVVLEPIDKKGAVDRIKAIQSFLLKVLQPNDFDSDKEKENKRLVRLHFLEGVTLQSLGDELNVSREAVRQRVSRTLIKLREAHEDDYLDDSVLQMNQELN